MTTADIIDVLRLWEDCWGDTEDCPVLQAQTWLESHPLQNILDAICIARKMSFKSLLGGEDVGAQNDYYMLQVKLFIFHQLAKWKREGR